MPADPHSFTVKKPVTERNPLKFDPELRDMVGQVGKIQKYSKFHQWKGSFLARFEQFLVQEGIDRASDAHTQFKSGMDIITHHVDNVESFVQRGDLTNDKVTVKGRNSLNEMSKALTICCDVTEALIPSMGAEERRRGYNKFLIGAVLVRDGFAEYDRMRHLNDVLEYLGSEHLTDVADKQQHELFETYEHQFKRFCEIMEDLGLYEVMMACRRFAHEPEYESESEPEPEPEPEPELEKECIIIIDMHTASIFDLEREVGYQKGIITQGEEPDSILESCPPELLEELRTKVKDHPHLGVATQLVVTNTVNVDDEDIVLAEAEKVSSVWGVSLKKRKKKVTSHEIIFLDTHTGAVGEIPRSKVVEKGAITECKDEIGKETIEEAVTSIQERDELVSQIRLFFNIKLI